MKYHLSLSGSHPSKYERWHGFKCTHTLRSNLIIRRLYKWGPWWASALLICDYANLRCAWYIALVDSLCKWDVVFVFFNLCVVSKSPAEISTPIGAVLELHSRANLPCLVNLALNLLWDKNLNYDKLSHEIKCWYCDIKSNNSNINSKHYDIESCNYAKNIGWLSIS